MVEAAIFDMDGLLIDSEPFWRRSHIEVLSRYGFIVTEDEVRAAAGKRTRDQVMVWHHRFQWDEPSIDDMTKQVVENVINLVHIHGEALAGVNQAIELFIKHKIPMAVASSSSSELIKVVLEKLDLEKHMEFAVSGEDEKHGKPAPDIFFTAAKNLGVPPERCVVFEDSLNGIKAAKAAGMKCIAVPETGYDHPEFQLADLVIPSLEKLRWQDITNLWKN
jgi:HAD superfamily hydrolase (TIGR01509 family)